jgi:enamine deaminase RidA (YjgF/YER057c/UK114 family)
MHRRNAAQENATPPRRPRAKRERPARRACAVTAAGRKLPARPASARAWHPATGSPGDGIEAQTELARRNLDAILTAAGASLSTLVKTTIFYANVDDFDAINVIYAQFMPDPPPARSAPANVALPRGLLISIDAIAALPPA